MGKPREEPASEALDAFQDARKPSLFLMASSRLVAGGTHGSKLNHQKNLRCSIEPIVWVHRTSM